MKLARVIAESWYGEDATEGIGAKLADHITTHLAPIREAINAHLNGDCGDTKGLRAALARMEEENDVPK